jgi:hypothetical protein
MYLSDVKLGAKCKAPPVKSAGELVQSSDEARGEFPNYRPDEQRGMSSLVSKVIQVLLGLILGPARVSAPISAAKHCMILHILLQANQKEDEPNVPWL